MYNHLKKISFLFLILGLTACSKMEVSNPFATDPVAVESVNYGQIIDIPVPSYMKREDADSLVILGENNQSVGVETFSGGSDIVALNNTMIHIMAKNGWTLLGFKADSRYVQIHKKDARLALLYLKKDLVSTTLEVWVFDNMEENSSREYYNASQFSQTNQEATSLLKTELGDNSQNPVDVTDEIDSNIEQLTK